jgi:molybdopterin-guanine dinucleotide biosynthesis protein A
MRLAAVVLTGGTGTRLGGVDKASLEIDGLTLLERALAATVAAEEVVVVGDRVPTSRPVIWTRETPVGGGPAAGLLAGLDALAVRPDLVCVLAVDMPRVVPSTVARLMEALADDPAADAAVLVDEEGVRQTLAGVYRYDAFVSARPGERAQERGLPIRRLIASLRIIGVAAVGDEARDVDTWEDLRHLGG